MDKEIKLSPFIAGLAKIAKEYAKGIPDKKDLTDPPEINEPKILEFAVQEHQAERAGKHYDLRIGDPESGRAFSWALPKARLPEPGEKLLAIPQPIHSIPYMDFSGVISEGYGKGKVKLPVREKVEVIYSKPGRAIRFHRYIGRDSEEYLIFKGQSKGDKPTWFITNVTPQPDKDPDVPGVRPVFKSLPPATLVPEDDDSIWLGKIDGATTITQIKKGKGVRVYGPLKDEVRFVDHSPRLPAIRFSEVPPELDNTILRSELYAVDPTTGKAIPARHLSGLLNSAVWTFKNKQNPPQMRLAVIDVLKYKGKNVENALFKEKWEMMKEVSQKIPSIELPPHAETREAKSSLFNKIKSGQDPITEEGIVIRQLSVSGVKPIKSVFRPTHDVYVKGIVPMIGHPELMGAFEYSWEPKGPVVGTVGTGFDLSLRTEVMKNPENYLGRAMKVTALAVYPSGALRAPAFKEFHLEKGKQLVIT